MIMEIEKLTLKVDRRIKKLAEKKAKVANVSESALWGNWIKEWVYCTEGKNKPEGVLHQKAS